MRRSAFRSKPRDAGVGSQRHDVRKAGRLDSGQPLETFDDPLAEQQATIGGVAISVEVYAGNKASFEIEPRIHRRDSEETPKHKR